MARRKDGATGAFSRTGQKFDVSHEEIVLLLEREEGIRLSRVRIGQIEKKALRKMLSLIADTDDFPYLREILCNPRSRNM